MYDAFSMTPNTHRRDLNMLRFIYDSPMVDRLAEEKVEQATQFSWFCPELRKEPSSCQPCGLLYSQSCWPTFAPSQHCHK